RDGKASYYEGGTRVPAVAFWPGHIKPGSVVDGPVHVVDIYPTLAKIAGATLGKNKALDGLDIGPSLFDGKPSPRTEVVSGIEPFRGGVRQGDWKLVWQATLPSSVELFDLSKDPGEKTNLAASNPEKVAELQKRIEALAKDAVPPLILGEAIGTLR